MNYQNCTHYEELTKLVADNGDLQAVSFEIDDITGCTECTEENGNVCSLWIALSLVENMKSQISISDAKLFIDGLDERIKEISLQLVKSFQQANN